MQPLNVIQINASDIGGGVESVVRLHHAELQRQGHKRQLLVGKKKGDDADTTEIPFRRGPKGLQRAARWMQRKSGLENLYSPSFRAIEESFQFQPDVVHLHSIHGADSYADLAFVARISRRYPTVITLHDFWLMTGHCGYPLECPRWLSGCGKCPDLERYPAVSRDATRWNFARKKSLFRKSQMELIVPSEWLKEQARRSPILRQQSINVVANPIDSDVFSVGNRSSLRSNLGVADDEFAVMLIANNLNNPYKGMIDGIKALNQVKHAKAKVIIIGRSADKLADQIRLPSTAVGYTSSPAELAEYYRAVDLLLIPSRCETFGLVAAEAMACGTPVIAFDAGALGEVIGGDETGIVIGNRDVHQMAEQIDQLAKDPARRKQMSGSAVSRIRTLFTVPDHTSSTVDVYRKAIAAKAIVASVN
ncbi:MAG: glycosyltransferase [Planctomycetales bacterium]|nr:glycosyltransferase [Planctomycetales bacterium]